MTHNWKPGDVAMISGRGAPRRAAFYDTGSERGWWQGDGTVMDHYIALECDVDARPLVVIDPEDREQVERLYALMWRPERGEVSPTSSDPIFSEDVTDLTAALREFAAPTPPKPDEPTGLGAVVEDADGDRYVRVVSGPSDAYWHCVTDAEGDQRWAEIAAVRVLSEGVVA